MRKSILLLGNYPPPFGGVPTHIKYLTDYLANQGWNVHIISFAGKQTGAQQNNKCTIYRPTIISRWMRLLQPSTQIVKRARQHKGLLPYAIRDFLALTATASFAKELIIKHDIGLISAYHLLGQGTVGAWLSEEFSIPLVTTVFGEIYSQLELHKRRLPELQYILGQSKRILSCSHHCAKSFELLGLSPSVEAVHYGIDTTKFFLGSGGAKIRQQLGIAAHEKVIVYVGRMVHELGLHIFIQSIPDVLQTNNSVKFIIVGTTGELTASALALSEQHKNTIFVIPDIPFDELPLYYDAATLVVAPSINARACLGLVMAEAMATCKPVIGAQVGGTAEVIVDGETGLLIPPEDPGKLAEAILSLLHNDTVLDRMGQQGRIRAEAMFDVNKTNLRMQQIFEEAIA